MGSPWKFITQTHLFYHISQMLRMCYTCIILCAKVSRFFNNKNVFISQCRRRCMNYKSTHIHFMHKTRVLERISKIYIAFSYIYHASGNLLRTRATYCWVYRSIRKNIIPSWLSVASSKLYFFDSYTLRLQKKWFPFICGTCVRRVIYNIALLNAARGCAKSRTLSRKSIYI